MKLQNGLLFGGVIALDQITKFMINAEMQVGDSFSIIPGFFRITYLHNTGGAWSMFDSGNMMFFYIVTVIALIVMLYFYKHTDVNDKLTKYGLVIMMAGTLGNFIDRIVFQYVRDFLDFIIFNYDFPVFNVADIALCFGVFLIFLSVLLDTYGGFRKCKK